VKSIRGRKPPTVVKVVETTWRVASSVPSTIASLVTWQRGDMKGKCDWGKCDKKH
jgi:hypothetical protein